MREYKETHQTGLILLENVPEQRMIQGDFGIQIAKDGRIWVCINGVAFIRFKPVGAPTCDRVSHLNVDTRVRGKR